MPLPGAVSNPEEFDLLLQWLESYHPKELFDTGVDSSESFAHDSTNKAAGIINDAALRIIPKDQERRMGMVNVRDPAPYAAAVLISCRKPTADSNPLIRPRGRISLTKWTIRYQT